MRAARPAKQPGAHPFPPTATRAVASLDEAERLDGVVFFLEGLDVVVDSGAGRVGNLEAVDDLHSPPSEVTGKPKFRPAGTP